MNKVNKEVFETISSTSQYIKENINSIENMKYIVAINQTNGHGRRGNAWFSSTDNLMFSFKLSPDKLSNEKCPLITLAVGLAVRNTLSKISYNDSFLIKWPNDIIINDKKIAGIICEGIFCNCYSMIIGIGINVNQINFDKEIKYKATSLKLQFNKDYSKDEILEVFNEEFLNIYNNLLNDDLSFINLINKYNYLKNKIVNINNENYLNKDFECIKINNDGTLFLKDDKEKFISINSNEVTLKTIYQGAK